MRILIRCNECNKKYETKDIEEVCLNEDELLSAIDLRAICKYCWEDRKK
jgi:hypothetical protein